MATASSGGVSATLRKRPAPALFQFMMEAGPIELREAYATFNMGVGFAAYVSPENVDAALSIAKATGYDAWLAGHVKKEGSRKAVVVPSLESNDSLRMWASRYARLVLARSGHNKRKACRALGISYHTLQAHLRYASGASRDARNDVA